MKYFSASAHRLVGTGLPLLAAVSNYVATKSFLKKKKNKRYITSFVLLEPPGHFLSGEILLVFHGLTNLRLSPKSTFSGWTVLERTTEEFESVGVPLMPRARI